MLCVFVCLLGSLFGATITIIGLLKNLSLIDTFSKLMVTLEKHSGNDKCERNRLKNAEKSSTSYHLPNNIIIHFVTEIVWHLCSVFLSLLRRFGIATAFALLRALRMPFKCTRLNASVCVRACVCVCISVLWHKLLDQ